MFFTLGVVLVASSAPAVGFRCGLPDHHPGRASFAATAGINCQVRPPLDLVLQSTTHPIDVHYNAENAAIAADILVSAETSWGFESDVLGFPVPLTDGTLGGDADFDIYVETSQYGGYFCPENSAGGTSPAYSGWVSVSPSAFPAELVPAVVAHELNHARQMGIDAYEDQSFMEMTAAYVMDQVFDEVNLASGYIPVFQDSPESSLDYYVYAEPYQYGASLFIFWLIDEVYGKNYEALSYLWLTLPQPLVPPYDNEPDYLDTMQTLAEASGLTFPELYAQFSADRWFTGANHDGTFEEGDTYSKVAIARLHDLQDLPAQGTESVSEFGASFVEIVLGQDAASVEVTFTGDAASTWRTFAIVPGAGAQDRREIAYDSQGVGVVGDLAGRDRLVLAFVNLGDGTHDPDDDDWAARSFDYALRATRVPGAGGGGNGDDAGVGAACGCVIAAPARAPRDTAATMIAGTLLAGIAISLRRRSEA